ncbi:hypothetical protein ACE6H2_005868 [Prunus campanulata]
MATSTSSVPILSFNTVSSSSSSSLPSSFSCSSLSSLSSRYHGLLVSNQHLHGHLVVNCSSSEMDSSSDFVNVRHTKMPSMAPFGVTMNGNCLSGTSYKWQRVLLKVSGEALAGDHTQNIDPKVTMEIASEVASVTRLGIEVAIVVGGGNIFCGSSWAGSSGLDRSSADYIGMLATVMNSIFLQATMESIGIPTRVQTAFRMSEVVLKATNVDGVYDDNPRCNPNARLLDNLTYQEVMSKDLSVMDMTAITLCQENNIPVVVFNLNKPGNISKAIMGEKVGTLIGATWNSTVTRT